MTNTQMETSTPKTSKSNVESNTACAELTLKMLEQFSLNERVNISKWDLKFNGESDVIGLTSFLERVNELCIARSVTKQQLFKSAFELFEGKALVWYRSMKDNVCDWDSLCLLLREEFLPRDYNEKLWTQIKNRTQGDKESIGIYIAYMNNLFNRLTVQVKDEVKLKIIRKNILPFYQEKLMLVDITSQDELLDLCRKLEEARDSVTNFVPPGSQSDKSVVEPDLAYNKSTKKKIDNIELNKPGVSFENDHIGRKSSLKETQSITNDRQRENEYRDQRTDLNRETRLERDSYNSRDRYRRDSKDKHRDDSSDRRRDDSLNRYRDNSSERYRSRDRTRRADSYSSGFRSRERYTDYRNRDYSRDRHRDNSRSNSRNRDRSRFNSKDRTMYQRENHSRDRFHRDRSNHSNDRNRHGNYSNSSREITCYKCQGKNHFAKDCKIKKCFRCGKLNVTKNNCPTCSSGNARRNRF